MGGRTYPVGSSLHVLGLIDGFFCWGCSLVNLVTQCCFDETDKNECDEDDIDDQDLEAEINSLEKDGELGGGGGLGDAGGLGGAELGGGGTNLGLKRGKSNRSKSKRNLNDINLDLEDDNNHNSLLL